MTDLEVFLLQRPFRRIGMSMRLPGNGAGQSYRYHDVDHAKLAKLCKRRRGFVQACAPNGFYS